MAFKYTYIICLVLTSYLAYPEMVFSMDFELVEESPFIIDGHKFSGRLSVVATGRIVEGDHVKLVAALKQAGRDQYGNITLYLDSPGGLVSAALKMASSINFFEVTAIVKSGDVCASSCASILFISARIHFIEEGGYLAMHPCRVASGFISDQCNEEIANHAAYNGTPYSAVIAYMTSAALHIVKELGRDIEENDLIYIDKQAAIKSGLYGPPIYDPTLAIPTYDCDNTKDVMEITVCSDGKLSRYNASISKIYNLLSEKVNSLSQLSESNLKLFAESNLELFESGNKAFLKKARECKDDYACILSILSDWRHSLRTHYAWLLLMDAANSRDNTNEGTKFMTDFAIYSFENIDCLDHRDCGRPFNTDATYEFFMQNNALRMIYPNLETTGVANCLVSDLCDESIETYSIKELESLAGDAEGLSGIDFYDS